MEKEDDSLLLGSLSDRKLSVSGLILMIKNRLEDEFFDIEIEGEISGFTAHRSGHYYFTLKDEHAQIDAVMFKNRNLYIKFRPENGMKVIARGKVTVYEERGRMQLLVEYMEQVGLGDMLAALQRLIESLRKEGLFDEERKKPIPSLPKKIGLVTSRDGAALHDFLNVINRRFADVQILIHHAAVQGESAPAELIEAIKYLDEKEDLDVIVITRGGGSVEDLMPFNDELLARVIAACRTPVISAVGHEVDHTIADFVADLRAPTPSAAAELIIEKKDVLQKNLSGLLSHLSNLARSRISIERERLIGIKRSRLFTDPLYMVKREAQRLDFLESRLSMIVANKVSSNKDKVRGLSSLLESLNPVGVLGRGYSITTRADGRSLVRSSADVAVGEEIRTRFAAGSAASNITRLEES